MSNQKHKPTAQDMLKILQQKLGNLELTVHAMMDVLEEENLLDQERINQKAEEIVKQMQKEEDIKKEELSL